MKKITLFLLAVASSGITFGQATKRVLVEDETGAWCGYCPRGRTTAEDITASYPNAICIANHVSDTYTCTYTSNIDNAFNQYGYPGGMVDRKLYSGQGGYVVVATNYWKTDAANQLMSACPVNITITSTYNSSTRLANITVGANFVGNASGDMRISCLLEEDSVVNANDPQHNYMGNGCSSPDASSPWYSYPCSIPNYTQRDVVRTNLAPDWGTTGIIPASVTNGQNFTANYSTTVSSAWNASHMFIVAFVSYYNTAVTSRSVINANKVRLGFNTATGTVEHPDLSNLEVKGSFPNPFSTLSAMQFTLGNEDNVSIKVYNTMGQLINNIVDTKMAAGEHTYYWAGDDVNGNKVSSGVYFYTITTSEGKVTKQIVFAGE